MADNVPITAGSGTIIATDQVGTDHYQRVKIADGAADSSAMIGGDATNGLDVDVTRIAAGDNNIGNVDVVTVPADPFGANADAASATGSMSAKLRFIAATGIPITAVTPGTSSGSLGKQEDAAHSSGDTGVLMLGVRNTGHTARVDADGDYTPIAVDAEGCLLCVGNVAHDSPDADPPVKQGFKNKLFDGTAPGTTVSAENDRADGICDGYGRQYVETTHPNYWRVSADYASAQTNTSLKTAPGTNLCLFITDIVISNGATAGNITLLDGSGGSVVFEIYPPVNGGVAISLRTPIKLTANTALCITSTTVTTHAVNICGFTAAVSGGV